MVMRINGLASGMDIDSIVKELMNSKRQPLNKLNQQKQIMEWTRESYREINSKLVDFRNNKLATYKMSSSMNTMKSTVSGNTLALTAEATATANQIPMNVTVNQMASNAKVTTTSTLTNISSKSTLKEVAAASGFKAVTEIDPDGNSKISYKMNVNGQSLTFDESKTISEVVNTINGNSVAKLTAVFDQVKGQLSFTAKQFDQAISLTPLEPEENGLLNLFNLLGADSIPDPAQKAKVTVNGIPKEFDSNKFILNGVSITLNGLTEDGQVSKITTTVDATKILDTITSFVKDYNELLNILNSKKNEQKYRDFPPLSDDQKKNMTDDEIEKWQTKAMSGLLKNDSILTSATTKLREAVQSGLNGIGGVSLSSIGIDTGQYFEGGKLNVKDLDKLKKAIEDNPQGVMNLFQTSSLDITKPKGIFIQLFDSLDGVLGTIANKAGTMKYSTDLNAKFKEESVMGERLKDLNKRVSMLTARLATAEVNYFKQFSAMETAINRYNSQSTSLSGYFA